MEQVERRAASGRNTYMLTTSGPPRAVDQSIANA
jgi:hypothetical protein